MEKRKSPKELSSSFLSGSKAVKGPWRNVLYRDRMVLVTSLKLS